MAEWQSTFIEQLKAAVDGTGNYHPRFRLIIGTEAFSAGGTWGHFEDSDNVIVAGSHSRGAFADDLSISSVDRYMSIPKSLGRFKVSAQSVQPRSWQYSAPQLQIEISPELAAAVAKYAAPGALCEMQVNINGEPGGFSERFSGRVSWSTIFLGTFRQMTYSGGVYSLTSRGFYEASIGHPMVNRTDAVELRDIETDSGGFDSATLSGVGFKGTTSWAWFANVGSTVTVGSTWDGTDPGITPIPPSGGTLFLDAKKGAAVWLHGFGQRRSRNGKFDDAYSYATTAYNPFYGYGAAVVEPSTSEHSAYYVSYGDPDNYGTISDVGEFPPTTGDAWFRGANDRSDHSRLGAYSSCELGSTVSSRVVINGNPAIELATILYSRDGWRCPWWTSARLFSDHAHAGIIEWTKEQTKANPTADLMSPRGVVSTMCGVVSSPQANGKSFLDSTFGTLGIFPVFKAGALGVSCCLDITGLAIGGGAGVGLEGPKDLHGAEGFEKTLTRADIQSIDKIDFRAAGLDTTYQRIEYNATGKEDEATAAVTCSVSTDVKYPREVQSAATEPESPFHEFPAGQFNTIYPDLIANDYKRRVAPWMKQQFGQVDLTLRGLEYAYLAPGDLVKIELDRPGFNIGRAAWLSPSDAAFDSTVAAMVISHQVDWLRGSVRLSVLRWVSEPDSI